MILVFVLFLFCLFTFAASSQDELECVFIGLYNSVIMSIYCWTLGEIALARIAQKVYVKVQITKNPDGIFHDQKVLGVSSNEDGSVTFTKELCYFVEICRSKETLWLPYTSLHLAARSRPYYGRNKIQTPVKTAAVRKRQIKEDHTLPLSATKQANVKTTDLNTTFDIRQLPIRVGKFENAYKEFLRRGKDMVFDEFLFLLKKDINREDDLEYLMNVDASTEDKFETVIKNIVTEKEVKSYLQHCWRFNYVNRETDSLTDSSDSSNASSPVKGQVSIHTSWCLVCGKRDRLIECPQCPSSFHNSCRSQWIVTIMHRKNPPKAIQSHVTTVDKVLSSTRKKTTEEPSPVCPSCVYGPGVGYGDVVWHKLGNCPWWPARVLAPGSLPSCLLARKHGVHQWPVKYYAENKYSWCDVTRMSLFLPSHTAVLHESRPEEMQQAVLDACDDYISVYLT